MQRRPRASEFYGWDIPEIKFETAGFECGDCPNVCEIVEIRKNEQLIARFGSRCKKWDDLALVHEPKVDQRKKWNLCWM